jgi:hypothetical protein
VTFAAVQIYICMYDRFWGTSILSELKQTVRMKVVCFSEILLHTHTHTSNICIRIWIQKLLIMIKS